MKVWPLRSEFFFELLSFATLEGPTSTFCIGTIPYVGRNDNKKRSQAFP